MYTGRPSLSNHRRGARYVSSLAKNELPETQPGSRPDARCVAGRRAPIELRFFPVEPSKRRPPHSTGAHGQLCDLPENDRPCLGGTHAQAQAQSLPERDTQRPGRAQLSSHVSRTNTTRGRLCRSERLGRGSLRRWPDRDRRDRIRRPGRAGGRIQGSVRAWWTGSPGPLFC